MKEKILIVSENNLSIPYKNTMIFFDCNIVSNFDVTDFENNKYRMVIIESFDSEFIIKIGKQIREINPYIGILVITNENNPFENSILKLITGYGITKILYWNEEYPERILEESNTIINPEYSMGRSDIAIVLPVYNEESRFNNVADFVVKLKLFLEKGFFNTKIYFVNDGSVDNTEKLINLIVEKGKSESEYVYDKAFFSKKELLKNTKKAGTYIEGIKTIEADILIFVDADNSFTIDDIATMINILRRGYYDMVVGTKDMTAEDRPLIRRMMSFAKRLLTKSMLPNGVYDSQTGLKAMKASSAKFLLPYLSNKRGLAIDLEMMFYAKKLRYRVLQLPIVCIDREGSHVEIVKDSISFLKNIFSITWSGRKYKF